MKPPTSTLATVAVSLGALAAGGAIGALILGEATKGKGDPLMRSFAIAEGGVFGVLATGFAGVVLAAAAPAWRRTGETTALVGVGAPLVLATLGITKSALALNAPPPNPTPAGGSTITVGTANSGQSVSLKVGDTLNVQLPSGMSAPAVSATGVLAAGQPSSSKDTQGNTTTVSPFYATGAGQVTVTSSAQGVSFTLTVTVSS